MFYILYSDKNLYHIQQHEEKYHVIPSYNSRHYLIQVLLLVPFIRKQPRLKSARWII